MDKTKFIKDVIGAYEKHLEVLKRKKKKEESANVVGTIFGLRQGLEIMDERKISKVIMSNKDEYIQQKDPFKCGKMEGLSFVMHTILEEEDTINLGLVLINYAKRLEF